MLELNVKENETYWILVFWKYGDIIHQKTQNEYDLKTVLNMYYNVEVEEAYNDDLYYLNSKITIKNYKEHAQKLPIETVIQRVTSFGKNMYKDDPSGEYIIEVIKLIK